MFRHVEVPTAVSSSILLIELDADTAEMYNGGLSLEGFGPYVAADELIECVAPRARRLAAELGCAALLLKRCIPGRPASVARQVAGPFT